MKLLHTKASESGTPQRRAASTRHFHLASKCYPTAAAPAAGSDASSSGRTDAEPGSSQQLNRRALMLGAVGGAIMLASSAAPASALPLAPLGRVKRVGDEKLTQITAEEVKEVLRRDLEVGQYFVTGNLTKEIFADDCRFVDPTNDVQGLSRYLTALGVLFDPETSGVRLIDIQVTGPRTVEADWQLGGYLKFPWNPRIEPLSGHTVYTLGEADGPSPGLVVEQRQTWSISALTALVQSFTPTPGPKVPPVFS